MNFSYHQSFNIRPLQNPNRPPNQHRQQYYPEQIQPLNFPNDHDQDFSWRVFKLFGHLYMWEEIVCLYIITLDFETDISDIECEIDSIKLCITEFSNGLETKLPNSSHWIDVVDRYWNSRSSSNETERTNVKKIIDHRLGTPYFSVNKDKLIDYLKTMTRFQKTTLRSIFLSRLHGYKNFANYLNKFHQSNNRSVVLNETLSQQKNNIGNLETNSMDEGLRAENEGLDERMELETHQIDNSEIVNNTTNIHENEKLLKQQVNILQKDKDELVSKLGDSNTSIVEKNLEIKLLKEKINNHVMDVEWRDDDENNSMQLVREIENLNRALNKIIGVKRNVKEIKKEAVKELFSSFGCTNVDNGRMKLVLEAALQQHLIDFILKSVNRYIKDISEEQENTHITENKLEAIILSKTEELINLITRFEETKETDEHSRMLPTVLRQQSYATLGNRGFSINHPFIKQLTKDLTNEMNRYRIIESEEKNKKFEKEIIKIIIQVIRIFYFRLKTQEPVPLMKFYTSGEDIDPDSMEGNWEGHYEDYEVEICSFPAVFVKSDERIYTRAQVISRPKKGT